jgi:hypothetical protein
MPYLRTCRHPGCFRRLAIGARTDYCAQHRPTDKIEKPTPSTTAPKGSP